jgi:hypothetical protein
MLANRGAVEHPKGKNFDRKIIFLSIRNAEFESAHRRTVQEPYVCGELTPGE